MEITWSSRRPVEGHKARGRKLLGTRDGADACGSGGGGGKRIGNKKGTQPRSRIAGIGAASLSSARFNINFVTCFDIFSTNRLGLHNAAVISRRVVHVGLTFLSNPVGGGGGVFALGLRWPAYMTGGIALLQPNQNSPGELTHVAFNYEL